MKKATDLEQETWVMHVPHYIAEISIFMAIWPFFLAKWTPYWQRIWCEKGNGPRTGNLGDACPWLHSRNILFWKKEPHIDQEFDVKKATDHEQETWVMPVPRYIEEISFFGKMLWRQHPVLQGVYLNMMCIHYTGSPLHMQWRHYWY